MPGWVVYSPPPEIILQVWSLTHSLLKHDSLFSVLKEGLDEITFSSRVEMVMHKHKASIPLDSIGLKMSYSAGTSTTRLSSDNNLMKRVIHIGLGSSSAFATLLF